VQRGKRGGPQGLFPPGGGGGGDTRNICTKRNSQVPVLLTDLDVGALDKPWTILH
jgi:hypothetical protein